MESKQAETKQSTSSIIVSPRQTIYVNNLPTKLSKYNLKMHLYHLFTPFGQILDIVAAKTHKARGQAFIVFKETPSAVRALRELQGFNFFGKQIRLAFAKTTSKASLEFEHYILQPMRVGIARQAVASANAAEKRDEMVAKTGMALQTPQAFITSYAAVKNHSPINILKSTATIGVNEEELEMDLE